MCLGRWHIFQMDQIPGYAHRRGFPALFSEQYEDGTQHYATLPYSTTFLIQVRSQEQWPNREQNSTRKNHSLKGNLEIASS